MSNEIALEVGNVDHMGCSLPSAELGPLSSDLCGQDQWPSPDSIPFQFAYFPELLDSFKSPSQ